MTRYRVTKGAKEPMYSAASIPKSARRLARRTACAQWGRHGQKSTRLEMYHAGPLSAAESWKGGVHDDVSIATRSVVTEVT